MLCVKNQPCKARRVDMSGNNRKQCNFNTFEMSSFSSLRLHAMTALTVLQSHIPTYLYSFAGNALRV